MFSDKTEHNIQMSKVISRYLDYIEELYQIVENNIDKLNIDEKQFKRIRQKYKIYKQEHGAEIKEIFYVKRDEPFPHMSENADFSPEIIKNSIKEGEEKTNEIINKIRRGSTIENLDIKDIIYILLYNTGLIN